MKRLLSLFFALIMIFSLSSCALLKTEEVLTFYNSEAGYAVDCIAIATSPDVMNASDKIIIFDYNNYIAPKTSRDYFIEIPDSKLDDIWYIYVSGGVDGFMEMYKLEQEVGALFDGEVYGFEITFDEEAENFVLIPLSGV